MIEENDFSLIEDQDKLYINTFTAESTSSHQDLL